MMHCVEIETITFVEVFGLVTIIINNFFPFDLALMLDIFSCVIMLGSFS